MYLMNFRDKRARNFFKICSLACDNGYEGNQNCSSTCRFMCALSAEEHVESLINSIETFSGNITDLDDRIFKHMETNGDVNALFDLHSFRISFLRGLNKVVTKLLTTVHVNNSIFSTIGDASAPLLFDDFKVNENVVMEVLQRHHDHISKTITFVSAKTKENLLHIFLKKSLAKAIVCLADSFDINHLYFAKNAAGNTPLNLAIDISTHDINCLHMEEITDGEAKTCTSLARIVWSKILQTNHIEEINNLILHLFKKRNVLHSCALSNQLNLLTEICLKSSISENLLKEVLRQPDADGQSPVHLCNDQDVVLKIIEGISCIDLDHLDGKGNNQFHIFANNNISTIVILSMILHWHFRCSSTNTFKLYSFIRDIFIFLLLHGNS